MVRRRHCPRMRWRRRTGPADRSAGQEIPVRPERTRRDFSRLRQKEEGKRLPDPWSPVRGRAFPVQWGRSSAGRASQWHCEGQGFDPPRLHHSKFLVVLGFLRDRPPGLWRFVPISGSHTDRRGDLFAQRSDASGWFAAALPGAENGRLARCQRAFCSGLLIALLVEERPGRYRALVRRKRPLVHSSLPRSVCLLSSEK